ncbi:MHYT domain-containing protein [Paenibacillus lemnae]|uniref:Circadian input-output histidine kinase CikA n=1 Tax=Paenibacillus lemnae TaxID=1330551 RepID=A0A848M6S0_PAELE|nr:MHYT domain-containing protein [Paenibacillus lemnae]NMO95880.1 PAS domain S-box protein [Paenibacillus lemnae]
MHDMMNGYNEWTVVLSVSIAVIAAYLALDLIDWVIIQQKQSLLYIFLISLILGAGIWGMHFTGMLSLNLGYSVNYEPVMFTVSFLLPVMASFFAVRLMFSDHIISKMRFILSGLLISMAIVSMHYAGMLAIQSPLIYQQNLMYMLLSVIITMAAVFTGLYLGMYRSPRDQFRKITFKKVSGAVCLGIAVSAMHYTAMAGTMFTSVKQKSGIIAERHLDTTVLSVMVSGAAIILVFLILTGLYLDRKKVLSHAKFNERRYMTLFEHNPDLVICIDHLQRKILSANPAVLATTGYTAEELLSADLDALFWKRRDFLIMMAAVRQAAGGSPRQVEVRLKHQDGSMVVHSATVFPLENPGHHLSYIITKDVTHKRLFEQELMAAKEAAESAANIKSEFLATMSHELRTPLNGIIGINELLSDGEEDEDRKELLELQAKSSHALLTVINDILDLSKMEAGKVTLVNEIFSIRQLIEECFDLFEIISRDKDIVVKYSLDQEIPELILGDPMRLRQILVNLIGNALKFTEQGSVSLEVRIAGETAGRYMLEFTVTDTGIGIDPKKADNLFKPFSQLNNGGSGQRRYEGTGLGLAICNKLVEMMEGEIWLEPRKERGARFAFRVQMEKAAS